MRWRFEINRRKIECEKQQSANSFSLPSVNWEDTPPYHDHSYLECLNNRASKLGLGPIFSFVTAIHENNGEKFVSDYLEQQEKRNDELGVVDKASKLCKCDECSVLIRQVCQEQQQDTNVSMVIDGNQSQEPCRQDQLQQQKPKKTMQATNNDVATSINNNSTYIRQVYYMNGMMPPLQPQCWSPFATMIQQRPCCDRVDDYRRRKIMGQPVRGRPPKHDARCYHSLYPSSG